MENNSQKNTAFVWFRNDLRVHDNSSLHDATQNHKQIIGVYCFDPRHFEITEFGFKKTEKFRAKFLIESVLLLKAELDIYNIPLFVYLGKPEEKIPELIQKYNCSHIYCQKEWTSEELSVTNAVKLKTQNSIWTEQYDQFLFHPNDINFEISQTPQVFTVFRKKLEKSVEIRPLVSINTDFSQAKIENNTNIPSLQDLGFKDFKTPVHSAFLFKGGEKEALKRLTNYFWETKKLSFYKKTRNGLIGIDYSSKFSAWLANGCISAKTIYYEVQKYENEIAKNQSTYWLIFELIWRDYFKYISLKHNNDIFKIGGILHKKYEWKKKTPDIQNWINGKTQKPFINANMIEIQQTGWMSNRGRQNVASYFTKDLLLDWRIGAAYFESLLIDYDVHSNYGNWMYIAGVGNDPRDRKFNIELQAERYDAGGKFQRLWLEPKLF